MIIELVLKNWLSFRDETVFSMVTQGEKRFLKRVPQIRSKPVLNINPVAVLYGGNASGKSNLLSFFGFLKTLVLNPIHEVGKAFPLRQYVLSKADVMKPTVVDFTFLTTDDHIFTLHLALAKDKVLEESLSVEEESDMRILYERKENIVSIMDDGLKNDEKAMAFKEIVRQNQLYLAIAGQEVELLNSAIRWFSRQLKLIDTDAVLAKGGHCYVEEMKREKIADLLEKLDTGIGELKLSEANEANLPLEIVEEIQNDLMTNAASVIEIRGRNIRFYATQQNGMMVLQKLVPCHRREDGVKQPFELGMEAQGTVRLLDILPAFLELEDPSVRPVYIIDELDRSWHYMLSKKLLGIYLRGCTKDSRSQLLFSTHDLMLMDQNLFRRSEMFLTERSQEGVSSVFSLNMPGLRYDKDIRKMYLQGALGGIPCLRHYGALND